MEGKVDAPLLTTAHFRNRLDAKGEEALMLFGAEEGREEVSVEKIQVDQAEVAHLHVFCGAAQLGAKLKW